MNFTHWDLGQLTMGSVITVDLTGTEANVQLFDATNFAAFSRGAAARGVGGSYRRSPAGLRVPSTGHWYVVVDYGGYAGSGTASVSVRPS